MSYHFRPMGNDEARAIVGWRYEKPYDIYNIQPEEHDRVLLSFLDPRNAYYVIHLAEEVVGFCCFGPDARVRGGEIQRRGGPRRGLGIASRSDGPRAWP